MRKIRYLFVFLALSFLCLCQVSAQPGGVERADLDIRPAVTVIGPPSGPPGTFVEIRGSSFGNEQRDRVVKMIVDGVSTVPVELTAFSWSRTMVVARIPGVEEVNYQFERPGSGEAPRNVKINISDPGAVPVYTDANNFSVTPAWGHAPLLHRVEPGTIDPAALSTDIGRIITVYGSRIQTPQGDRFVHIYKVGGGPNFRGEIVSWSSTVVVVRLPDGLENGTYALRIAWPAAGGGTNSSANIYFTVGPVFSTPPHSPVTGEVSAPVYSFVDSVIPGVRIPDAPVCRALTLEPPEGFDATCWIMFWQPPQITDMQPGIGPSGQYLDIKGRCFGNDFAGKKVRISGEGFFEPRGLEIIAWADKRIVARLPGPEEIITSSTGEEVIRSYPDGTPMLMYDLIDMPLRAEVEITREDGRIATGDFTINPYRLSDPPVICGISGQVVAPGECFKIYGAGFGRKNDWSQVGFERSDGGFTRSSHSLWTSSEIRYCVPADMRTGTYRLDVSRSDGAGNVLRSNSLDMFIGKITSVRPAASVPERPQRLEGVERAPLEYQRQPSRGPDIEMQKQPVELQPMGVGGKSKTGSSGGKSPSGSGNNIVPSR